MQFRFQRILELKERVEEARKAALGEAVAAMEEQREQLARLVQAKEVQTAAPRASDSLVNVSIMAIDANYGQRLEREVSEQEERFKQANVIVDDRRGHLHEASKERRVFEVLRERVAEEYRRDQRRQEQVKLDETGARFHQRRQQDE